MSSESLRTPPRLINGRLLELRAVPDAGYGVYATEDIPAQTIVLTDPDPIIYAINGSEGFKTCSWCFRTTTKDSCDSFLERDGMSFCKDECMTSWKEKYEEEGLAAHAAVYEFIRSEEVCQLMDHDYKFETKCMLSEMEVEEIWSKAEEQAASIRSFRLSSEPNSDSTTLENGRQAREEAMRTPVRDGMALFLFLSGVLCRDTEEWSKFLTLKSTEKPRSLYKTQMTASSYLYLMSILPQSILRTEALSRATLEEVFTRHETNNFGLWSDEDEEKNRNFLAYGVWPGMSLFNHSCVPNVEYLVAGRSMVAWTNHDIHKGEEVCISYIEGLDSNLEERREALLGAWGFICQCAKCSKEESDSPSIHLSPLPFVDIHV